MTDTIQQENELEEVIRSMRLERERIKAAKKSAEESIKLQTELSKVNSDAVKKSAEANLNNAEAEQILSKAKIDEAREKAKIHAQEIKNEQQKVAQDGKRKSIDQSNTEGMVDEIERLRKKAKRLSLEEKEFQELANKMGEIREMIKSPITRLYNLAADKGFDIRKRPISTAIGVTGLAANAIVNQDKVPPIFGILVKAITGGMIFISGIIEKRLGLLVDKIRGFDPGADELVKVDPILREIYAINKKMALELATLKIQKFRSDVIDRGIKEKNELIMARSERFEKTSKESVIENISQSLNKNSKDSDASISNGNVFQSNRPGAGLINKLDEIINLVKSINNHFDTEEDRERYTAELSWRNEVLDKLEYLRTGEVTKEKSTFGFLESGALASIATFAKGAMSNILKFLTPLATLGKGLLRFAVPLSIVSGLLLTLDWNKDLVEPIQKIKSTFADGKFLEGLFRSISLPFDIVTSFVNRSISSIAGIFGFTEVEKEFKNIADNFNFMESMKTLSTNLFNYINDITKSINLNFINIKDRVLANLNAVTDIINQFDISKSVSDIFDTISEKVESLKFWNFDKKISAPDFIKKLTPDRFKENISSLRIQNENNINNISKLDTSKNIRQLTSLHEKIITRQNTNENLKLDRLTEKLGNINTNIVNQQVNNSNVTSISGRPKPRIEDIYSYKNHNSDFSGYQIS